ncbi:Gfo/Idh/MocA family protein [Thermoflavimicrobium dichotomicum]|uniref:Virulence factor n=1 Tax=Thermoflavimicrobium dichotomicum TaxID=46223 RepID=A0A1I3U0S9_9BACL|nr:Gfo/Idh/MocA family oxidoreductase [Thermoflavimicrobium dichotomicum]SFJ75391.1 virulence factor [Thermoflavimicrobium dichotomicum]
MNQPKVGMIGLGSIAQKVYLPLLSIEKNWKLVGAYSPTKSKRDELCRQYRIESFNDMDSLLTACDAIFVHSSTDTHYEIVEKALQMGKDVYVDKPLAATVEQAKRLVELSNQLNRKLMVGFNRRFAPLYVEAKQKMSEVAWIRIEKHRINGIYPNHTYDFTLLDSYLHLVDTARWLGATSISDGIIQKTGNNQLLYTQHNMKSGKYLITTSMHRKAGTNLEQLEIVSTGSIMRVKNLDIMEIEAGDGIQIKSSDSWESILKRRGFEGAVNHFIDCLIHDHEPIVNGWEGLQSQQWVEQMVRKNG